MPEPIVLVVDDEAPIVRLLKLELESAGLAVVTAATGAAALKAAKQHQPDAILLDIKLPDVNGIDILPQLRAVSKAPVVAITADGSGELKTRALEAGVDDFVTKPFRGSDVVDRVRFLLRIGEPFVDAGRIRAGDLEIDLVRSVVRRHGELLELSQTEWRLIQQLAMKRGHVVLSRELLRRVWGPEYADDDRFLRTWIARLRRKLEAPGGPPIIEDFHGVGYRLAFQGVSSAGELAG